MIKEYIYFVDDNPNGTSGMTEEEVVRCKDCAHWSDVELHVCEDGCYGICIIEESTTEANNWCKKGVYKWK